MQESLEERVKRLEARMRRQRIYSWIKNIILIIIIIGVALYLYGIYSTRGEWSIEPAGTPRIGLKSPRIINIELYLKIHNPTNTIAAKMIYYRIYLNGYYVGDGFIPYMKLPHGDSTHKITMEVDVSRLSCGLAKALKDGGEVDVRIAGFATIDLKTWGGLTWKSITVPFNESAGKAQLPDLDPLTKGLLSLYTYICNHPGSVYSIITGGSQGIPGFNP